METFHRAKRRKVARQKITIFLRLPDKICKLTSVAKTHHIFSRIEKKNYPEMGALHIVMPYLVISMHYGKSDSFRKKILHALKMGKHVKNHPNSFH